MKKLLSLLCVLAVTVGILAVGAVSASAEVPATVVDVKSGDKVSYSLSLADVPEKIVGCDFSVYYDDSAFDIESVADFNDSTNDEDWLATINPDLPGEVRGNWSILNGVSFADKRNIVTLNLVATKDASAHVSYFVRYMYDKSVFDSEDRPQIDQYLFTCSVTKNGEPVVEDAEPELNVDEEQPNGLFPNSRTGRSADANTALTGDSIKENGGAKDDVSNLSSGGSSDKSDDNGSKSANDSGNNSGNKTDNGSDSKSGNDSGNNAGSGSDSKSGNDSGDKENNGSGNNTGNDSGNYADNGSGNNAGSESADNAGSKDKTAETKSDKSGSVSGQSVSKDDKTGDDDEKIVQTDADGSVVETAAANTASAEKKGGSALMWIIIAAIVVIAGGCIAYVVVKNKKRGGSSSGDDGGSAFDDDDDDDDDE